MLKRYSVSSLVGVFITLLLFFIMQALIAGGEDANTKEAISASLEFVRVKEDRDLAARDRSPKRPPPPEQPPPTVPPQFNVAVDDSSFTMQNLDMTVDVGGGFGSGDGEYLPIFKVPAMYPRRAQSRGMSGWVIVEFTVTATGAVASPFIVENCAWIKRPGAEGECEDNPSSVFDSSALKSALKYKYKPKVLDGKPKATPGVRTRIIFQLEE